MHFTGHCVEKAPNLPQPLTLSEIVAAGDWLSLRGLVSSEETSPSKRSDFPSETIRPWILSAALLLLNISSRPIGENEIFGVIFCTEAKVSEQALKFGKTCTKRVQLKRVNRPVNQGPIAGSLRRWENPTSPLFDDLVDASNGCNFMYPDKGETCLDEKIGIDSLPDEVLILIVSCLGLREAAKTCVLSRRWAELWTFTVGALDFEASEALKRVPKAGQLERLSFVKWVDKVLNLHRGKRIDSFRVHFDLNQSSLLIRQLG
ncbi:uncharacterized protein LOC110811222 [Carica papaya]|uniref:uncharacterized protein LOC110811222 n=1 Tax=Carica papaya TaxID=3649 RepID=UPI000B8D09DE|nr:uncharacterized protein LOC110811222 [Carica papaya]